MPFGLKNDGATYQRAMVILFHDMMHKDIEVYVDDINVKSREKEYHCQNLRKLFERIKRFQLKLNPMKCLSKVKSRKLLGFMVSSQGIEIDPNKVKAIQDMSTPKTEREVIRFLGHLNYIVQFISQIRVTCEPIFWLLEKKNLKE